MTVVLSRSSQSNLRIRLDENISVQNNGGSVCFAVKDGTAVENQIWNIYNGPIIVF